MALSGEQRAVASRIAAAALTTIVVMGAVGAAGWRPLPERDATGLAIVCLAMLGATLAVAIARVAAHRFFTPDDLAGSGLTSGTNRVRALNAVLQNTLEQVVLATPTYLAAAMLLPDDRVGVIAAAAVLFVLGRVSFTRGYDAGAAGRAFGFGLTFYPTVALLLSSLAAATAS
jgi:hypothetical protein